MKNSVPPPLRTAFHRVIAVLLIALGIVIYAYGWQVTDIDIEETQDPIRQQSVQRALRELFAPDIFEQDTESVFAQKDFQMGCTDNLPAAQEATDQSYIVVSPACGTRGDVITVEGFNFQPGAPVALRWLPPSGERRPLNVLGAETNVIDVDLSGHFSTEVAVPSIRGSQGTTHQIEVEVRTALGSPYLSDSTKLVIEKMWETVFLALMATTVAVPISVTLSFLAAHNLMPQVRIPMGSALIGFILLPIGWVLGSLILGPIGQIGITWGKELVMGVVGPVVAVAAYGVGATAINQMKLKNGAAIRARSLVMSGLLLVLVVFLLGALGGLADFAGIKLDALSDGLRQSSDALSSHIATLVGALGNFVSTLGRLIELSIGLIAAVAGAFLISWNAMELSVTALKPMTTTASHVLGGALGLAGGALLSMLAALIGTQGALLTLLGPLVNGLLGGAILALIYGSLIKSLDESRRITMDRYVHSGLLAISGVLILLGLYDLFYVQTGYPLWTAVGLTLILTGLVVYALYRASSAKTMIALVGAAVVFIFAYNYLGLSRSIVNGRLPPDIAWQTIQFLGVEIVITEYLRNAAFIGAVLGGVAGLLAGVHTAFPVGSIIYNTTRTILNGLRSIEPLIMGIVFVIWVGIGPFAGVLALTLHSIASLGKLYSEQIESIDPGPIEAILATGANRLQMIVYAVVPQIVPPYIAFTMYRWDINVRMSTIIGFVGGGGIGFLLQQQINLLRYRDAGVAVLAIAIVVSLLDYASAYIRERMV